MIRAVDVVRHVAPHAKANYIAAFEAGDNLLAEAKVVTPLRFGHFLAQVLAETGDLTIEYESMNYSAERLMQIFGVGHHSSAVTYDEAQRLAHHPEAIAERVYGYKSPKGKELGNDLPGDGWKYRGTGIMQTTGRFNFRKMGELCDVDFENYPELVLSAEHALKPALAEWTRGKCNDFADRNDLLSVSRIINIGNPYTKRIPNGMENRRKAFTRVWPLLREEGRAVS